MSRPLRIEFPGATYHVTSRGDRREPIYIDDDDRQLHLGVLAQATERFDAQVLAYCLMGNHFHLVLHTRQGKLSRLMRHLNGVYTQRFNRRHGLVGHLFQGRFKAILVDRDTYLLAVCKYVERNPVAAGLVGAPQDWPWSSYRAHVGLADTPAWLDTVGLHAYVLGKTPRTVDDHRRAAAVYTQLTHENGAQPPLWGSGLRQQVYLGDEAFVARMQALAQTQQTTSAEVPRTQRTKPVTLAETLGKHVDRNSAIHAAHQEGKFTMTEIAREMGLSVSRVSRLIAQQEGRKTALNQNLEAKGKT